MTRFTFAILLSACTARVSAETPCERAAAAVVIQIAACDVDASPRQDRTCVNAAHSECVATCQTEYDAGFDESVCFPTTMELQQDTR